MIEAVTCVNGEHNSYEWRCTPSWVSPVNNNQCRFQQKCTKLVTGMVGQHDVGFVQEWMLVQALPGRAGQRHAHHLKRTTPPASIGPCPVYGHGNTALCSALPVSDDTHSTESRQIDGSHTFTRDPTVCSLVRSVRAVLLVDLARRFVNATCI